MRKSFDKRVRRLKVLQTVFELELSKHERAIRGLNSRAEELEKERKRALEDGAKLREAGCQSFAAQCSGATKWIGASVIQRAGRFARCCFLGSEVSASAARAISMEIRQLERLRDSEYAGAVQRRAVIDHCNERSRATWRAHRLERAGLEESEVEDLSAFHKGALL